MKRLLLAASALVLVLTACGGSQRVPKGVSEIDIRAPLRINLRPAPPQIFSRSVTDPSQVKRIINSFDSLRLPGKPNYGCAGGLDTDVTLTFRSANGAELAKAYSPPAAAHYCDPIFLTVSGRRQTILIDSKGMTLIGQMKRSSAPGSGRPGSTGGSRDDNPPGSPSGRRSTRSVDGSSAVEPGIRSERR